MTTLWDTTGSAVVKALSAERRAAGALAFGLALTLVVVVDEKNVAAAENAATAAAAAHPCRLLIVVRRQIDAPHPRLDAEVSIGGRLGPGEAIVMRMSGRLALHAESVVLPLLASDAPVVTWWHDEPPTRIAFDPLGVFADRRVTDCASAPDPLAALRLRAADFEPGDTDLAWTRISGWRTLLAAAFDGRTDRPSSATIEADQADPSAQLFAGWLRGKLSVPVDVAGSGKRGIQAVRVAVADGEIAVTRADSRAGTITRPGVPPRRLPLRQLDVGDLLAEELRRLDDDAIYAEALSAWSGVPDLTRRSGHREHIWQDPMEQPPTAAAAPVSAETGPASAAAESGPASAAAKSGPVAGGGD